MPFHCVGRDCQRLGDLFVGQAAGQQHQHFTLALGQRVEHGVGITAAQGLEHCGCKCLAVEGLLLQARINQAVAVCLLDLCRVYIPADHDHRHAVLLHPCQKPEPILVFRRRRAGQRKVDHGEIEPFAFEQADRFNVAGAGSHGEPGISEQFCQQFAPTWVIFHDQSGSRLRRSGTGLRCARHPLFFCQGAVCPRGRGQRHCLVDHLAEVGPAEYFFAQAGKRAHLLHHLHRQLHGGKAGQKNDATGWIMLADIVGYTQTILVVMVWAAQ